MEDLQERTQQRDEQRFTLADAIANAIRLQRASAEYQAPDPNQTRRENVATEVATALNLETKGSKFGAQPDVEQIVASEVAIPAPDEVFPGQIITRVQI